MRAMVATAVVCFSLVGLAVAADAEATINRKLTNIPAQELRSALLMLEKDRNLAVIFVAEDIRDIRTPGAVGVLSPQEALNQLLAGTGLTYRFMDEKTISILLAPQPAMSSRKDIALHRPAEVEGRTFWTRLRLAQADTAAPTPEAESEAHTPISPDRQLGEVIVTAQKRAQNVQDVPISITALSGETLAAAGASKFEDYALGVPGLSAVNLGPGQTQLSMRGVSQGAVGRDQPQNRETVGIYIDEMPVAVNGFNPDLRLIDIDRVEILRGPQGTLYGSGSMTGTLKVVTRQPAFDDVRGETAVGFTSVKNGGEGYSGSGAVNLPISENLAARAVAYYEETPGFIDNSRLEFRDINESKVSGGRLAVKWRVNDDVMVDFRGYHQSTDVGGTPVEDQLLGADNLQQTRVLPEYYTSTFDAVGISATADLKWAELTSATSFIQQDILLNTSDDRNARFFVGGGTGPLLASQLFDGTKVKDVVQEIRLASLGESRFEWMGGLFFDAQNKTYTQDFPTIGIDEVYDVDTLSYGVNDLGDIFEGRTRIDIRQYAAFGEVAWNVIGDLKFTTGARWFRIDSDSRVLFRGIANGGTSDTVISTTDDGINPKANISYAFGKTVNVYAQAAKGFRLGGTNIGVPNTGACGEALQRLGYPDGAPLSFEPDELWNYELGLKTSFLDRRLIINTAIYHIDWKGIPFTVDTQCGFNFQDNAGKARTRGVEIELLAQPLPSLLLSLSGSYVDAELLTAVPSANAVPGDRLPTTPRYNASFTTRYSWPWGSSSATGFALLNVLAVGDTVSEFDADEFEKTAAYQTANLRLGVENERASIALAFNNLTDERVNFFSRVDLFGGPQVFRGRPREIGLEMAYRF